MTPCDPPCDECGCCCGAMLPTTLNAMIVTLEPVSIVYKLPLAPNSLYLDVAVAPVSVVDRNEMLTKACPGAVWACGGSLPHP